MQNATENSKPVQPFIEYDFDYLVKVAVDQHMDELQRFAQGANSVHVTFRRIANQGMHNSGFELRVQSIGAFYGKPLNRKALKGVSFGLTRALNWLLSNRYRIKNGNFKYGTQRAIDCGVLTAHERAEGHIVADRLWRKKLIAQQERLKAHKAKLAGKDSNGCKEESRSANLQA